MDALAEWNEFILTDIKTCVTIVNKSTINKVIFLTSNIGISINLRKVTQTSTRLNMRER